MRIFIYHDSNQDSLYQTISLGKYQMTSISNVVELEDKFNVMDVPILVVISQPSKILLDALLKCEWHVIISFIGIRNFKNVSMPIHYFESESEFYKLLETSVETQKESLKRLYINQFDEICEEDALYLNQLSGIKVNAKVSNVNKTKKNKKFEKSGLITVVGSSDVAVLMAKKIAKKSMRSVLIIDGDLLKPSLDVIFGIKNIQTHIKSHLVGVDNTGVNIALDTISKGIEISDSIDSITIKINRKLSVLLGNFNFYNYEHYEVQMLSKLLAKLQSHYQFVILSVNDSPYDSFTMLGIHQSMINLFVCRNEMQEIRYKLNLRKILYAKQGIQYEKNLVVTIDKQSIISNLGPTVKRYLFGKSYIGHLDNSKRNNDKIADILVERMGIWE